MLTTATQAVPAIFHFTHWKAGSQWVRGVFEDLFPDRLLEPDAVGRTDILEQPIRAACIYSPLYLTAAAFEPSPAARVPHRKFVVIRDLRDTLVSWYFSLRNSHPQNEVVDAHRPVLRALTTEEGLLYLMEHADFYGLAMIAATWQRADCLLVRFEDLVESPHEGFRQIMATCGLRVARDDLDAALNRWSFHAKAGRSPGQADPNSHFRNGQAGDWVRHFTPRLKDAFNERYGNLLWQLGYEPEEGEF